MRKNAHFGRSLSGGFGTVLWVDIAVFLFFLAIQLLLQVGILGTALCAIRALPHLIFELPVHLVRERYLTPASRQLAFTLRSTLFQDVVIRCVRYAFANIPSSVGRVFFSREVVLPFLKFRMLRNGYLGLEKMGLGRSRPGWRDVERDGLKGVLVAYDLGRRPDVVVYYCHGGGLAMGSAVFYLEFLLAWVSALMDDGFKNPAIFALEYTLVPDEVYPFQLQETIAGYEYARRMAGGSASVVVGGDSAGGTLILSLLLYLGAKAPEHRPAFAVLISPWTHLVSERNRNAAADFIDVDMLHHYARMYAGDAEVPYDPMLSPGDCEDQERWKASMPRRGMGFYYGTEEVFCENIRTLAKRLEGLETVPVLCREDESVHAWPVAELFLEDTAGKRGKGLRRISKDIARLCG